MDNNNNNNRVRVIIDNNKSNNNNNNNNNKYIIIENQKIHHTYFTKKAQAINKNNNGEKVSKKEIMGLYEKYGFTCQYCLDKLEDISQVIVEHIKPKAVGGTSNINNLTLSCKLCNGKKGGFHKNFDIEIENAKKDFCLKVLDLLTFIPHHNRSDKQKELFKNASQFDYNTLFANLSNYKEVIETNNIIMENEMVLQKYLKIPSYLSILSLFNNIEYVYYNVIRSLIHCTNNHHIRKLEADGIIQEVKLSKEELKDFYYLKRNYSIMKFYSLSDRFKKHFNTDKYNELFSIENNFDVYKVISSMEKSIEYHKIEQEQEKKNEEYRAELRMKALRNQGLINDTNYSTEEINRIIKGDNNE